MGLKKKIVETKTKIQKELKENPDLAIAIASQAVGFAALGLAYFTCNKLEKANDQLRRERRNHAQCHGFANWVIRRAEENGGTEKLIKAEDGMIHIHDKSENDTTED